MIKIKDQIIKINSFIFMSILFVIQSCSSNDFSKAESVIKKIEHYKKSHARLPDNLDEIGMNNLGPVYYDKLNGTHYQMFYEVQTGEFWEYNTIEKKWKYCPACASMFVNE